MTLRMVGAVLNRSSFDLKVTLDFIFNLSFESMIFALMDFEITGFELINCVLMARGIPISELMLTWRIEDFVTDILALSTDLYGKQIATKIKVWEILDNMIKFCVDVCLSF